MGFAENLKSKLAAKGMTQTELAAKIGVAQSQISRWLGPSTPSRPTQEAIAKALGCEVEDLWR